MRDSPTFLRDLFTRQVPGYEINVGKNPYEIEGAEEDKPLEDGRPQQKSETKDDNDDDAPRPLVKNKLGEENDAVHAGNRDLEYILPDGQWSACPPSKENCAQRYQVR